MLLNHKVLDKEYLILTEIQVHTNSPYMFGNGLQTGGPSGLFCWAEVVELCQ